MATLYIVSTPIGNVDDISLRAIKTLFTIPIIAAEDTRHTGNLIELLRRQTALINTLLPDQDPNAKPRFVSLHEHNEQQRIPQLLNSLIQGQDVALVSDAGTPLISDPGFRLVRATLEANIRVVALPGASALLTALVSSGQPPANHLFLGYLPTKKNARRKFISDLKENIPKLPKKPALIIYESPHRLIQTINDIHEVLGDYPITVAQELTKLHEKVNTANTSTWLKAYEKIKPKGEYVILLTI